MTILEMLECFDSRVVAFELSPDRKMIRVEECCDNYFNVDLSKEMFGQMIEELKALHAQMVS